VIKAIVAAVGLVAMTTPAVLAEGTATPSDILGLMVVAGAIVDYCKLDVDPALGPKMTAEVVKYQKLVNMSDADLEALHKQTADTVASSKPDCTENGDLVKAARSMIDLVKADQP
jgi:hypothetical protein